ncbi:MFS transporter [Agrobacterium bohemicum]|uniref:MFS transporter n=1 Tax=Agrobacterium bohemicum TaxID=2052828 RepID=A0A135NY39_9HYPH|nr:MFS transporter [Agrobacterium bohemicum]KXG84074.1 MFS transporter [Agrobacterium bohemicum]
MTITTRKAQPTVAARLERLPLTGYQRFIFLIIATAWLFDSMDLAAMTFMLGSIKSDLGLTTAQAGFVASASFIGMFFGASIAGLAADRFGRKPVFQVSMIVWGLGSLLCGLSSGYNDLFIYRIILGVGMGMELPVALAMVSEFIPSQQRGKYAAILEGFLPVGYVFAGILIYFTLPLVSWRGVFIILAVPAAALLVIRRFVPESPRWLESHGRREDANRVISQIEDQVRKRLQGAELPAVAVDEITADVDLVSGRNLGVLTTLSELVNKTYGKRSFMIWTVWFFTMVGYYGLSSWLGALLQESGYEVSKSIIYTVIMSAAGIPGFIFAAWFLEWAGRKKAAVVMLFGCAASAYVYGQCASLKLPVEQVVLAGAAMQFFFFGMWCIIYAYTPELYPTRTRATGAGVASSVGRLGSIIGPLGIGVLLPVIGQGGIFIGGAICFVVAALTIWIMGIETKGLSLEQISQ